MSPNETQDTTKQTQNGPEMRPERTKMVPGRHNMDSRWLPKDPRRAQAGPRWSQKRPKWMPNGAPTGKHAAYKTFEVLQGFYLKAEPRWSQCKTNWDQMSDSRQQSVARWHQNDGMRVMIAPSWGPNWPCCTYGV
jgi:hypothetical protein